jgi:hypothetical protein
MKILQTNETKGISRVGREDLGREEAQDQGLASKNEQITSLIQSLHLSYPS